jgi:hypothetical protein
MTEDKSMFTAVSRINILGSVPFLHFTNFKLETGDCGIRSNYLHGAEFFVR